MSDARPSVRALFVLLLPLLGWVTPVLAASSPDAGRHELRLTWRAPPTCPGPESFREEVNGLTDAATWSSDDPASPEVRVTLAPAEGGGSLVLLNGAEEVLRRDVSESDCHVMVRGLAFILAVVLDPSVTTQKSPETEEASLTTAEKPVQEEEEPFETTEESPRSEDDPLPSSTVVSGETVADPVGRGELLPRPQETPPLRPVRNASTPVEETPAQRRKGWREQLLLIASGTLESGLNRIWAPGAAASVELRLHPPGTRALLTRPRTVLGPTVRLGGQFATASTLPNDVGADVRRYGGLLQACPIWVWIGRRFGATPCLFSELGSVRASGQGADRATPASRLWGTVGALVRTEVPLGRRFRLGTSAGARFHTARYAFAIDSGEEPLILHETPNFSAILEISLGYHFSRSEPQRADIH